MTTIQKLTNELNEMNAKRNAVIEANTVENITAASNKGFTYRKHTVIKSSDLRAL